jgi:hypothetical protein
MGDRAQVHIKDEGVYLYTHWDAYKLPKLVQEAIQKHWRWDDPEYLARIIFDVMVGDDQGDETGYGISSSQHGDVWRVVEVDCANDTIRVVDRGTAVYSNTFRRFTEDDLSDLPSTEF